MNEVIKAKQKQAVWAISKAAAAALSHVRMKDFTAQDVYPELLALLAKAVRLDRYGYVASENLVLQPLENGASMLVLLPLAIVEEGKHYERPVIVTPS